MILVHLLFEVGAFARSYHECIHVCDHFQVRMSSNPCLVLSARGYAYIVNLEKVFFPALRGVLAQINQVPRYSVIFALVQGQKMAIARGGTKW